MSFFDQTPDSLDAFPPTHLRADTSYSLYTVWL